MSDPYVVVEETSLVDCHAHISAKEFDEVQWNSFNFVEVKSNIVS